MKRSVKIVAIVCVFSIVFTGCYTASWINPNGPEKEEIYSGTIKSVITKEGKEYKFDIAPSANRYTIVGVITIYPGPTTQQVAIPISDVAQVSISEFDVFRTASAIAAFVGLVSVVMLVVDPPEFHIF